jgi:hypothetical protein
VERSEDVAAIERDVAFDVRAVQSAALSVQVIVFGSGCVGIADDVRTSVPFAASDARRVPAAMVVGSSGSVAWRVMWTE